MYHIIKGTTLTLQTIKETKVNFFHLLIYHYRLFESKQVIILNVTIVTIS